jgi:hypothetical protein
MLQSQIISDWCIAQQADIFQEKHPKCSLNSQKGGRHFIETLIERRISPCRQCSGDRAICESESGYLEVSIKLSEVGK